MLLARNRVKMKEFGWSPSNDCTVMNLRGNLIEGMLGKSNDQSWVRLMLRNWRSYWLFDMFLNIFFWLFVCSKALTVVSDGRKNKELWYEMLEEILIYLFILGLWSCRISKFFSSYLLHTILSFLEMQVLFVSVSTDWKVRPSKAAFFCGGVGGMRVGVTMRPQLVHPWLEKEVWTVGRGWK